MICLTGSHGRKMDFSEWMPRDPCFASLLTQEELVFFKGHRIVFSRSLNRLPRDNSIILLIKSCFSKNIHAGLLVN